MFYKNYINIDEDSYERTCFQLAELVNNDYSVREWKEKVDEIFKECYENKTIFSIEKENKYQNSKTQYFVFDTNLCFKSSKEKVFGQMLRNTSQSSDCEYFGLYFKRESILRSELEPKLHIGDIVFENLNKFCALLNELGEKAIYENWSFIKYDSKIPNPILKNYLEHTYYQLYYEEKIVKNEKEKKICFNTGLINPYFKEIFIVCDDESEKAEISCIPKIKYTNPTILLRGERMFSAYVNKDPELAQYFSEPSEILFDWKQASKSNGINLSNRHIFEDNIKRINSSLPTSNKYKIDENLDDCISKFQSSLNYALELSKRNYKLIAPQFWSETGKIQFLLPIYLEGKCEVIREKRKEIALPNVAVCLEKDQNNNYIGTSILTLEMAYQNARLIARPDSFWLEPSKIIDRNSFDENIIEDESYQLIKIKENVFSREEKKYFVLIEFTNSNATGTVFYKNIFRNKKMPQKEDVDTLLGKKFWCTKNQNGFYSIVDVPEEKQINCNLLM